MAKQFFKIPSFVFLKIVFCFLVLFSSFRYLNAQTGTDDVENALVYFDRAYSFYNSGNLEFAHTALDEGISCSDTVADLFYLRALLYTEENYPAADILNAASGAFAGNRTWFRFDPAPASVFTAGLLVETGRCQEALRILDTWALHPSPDADLLRCRIYYGEGALPAARGFLASSLKRWSSDYRFPLLFFQFESRGLSADASGGQVMETAAEIISSWNIIFNPDVNPELSLAALPFIKAVDEDSALMVLRRIWYMDGRKSLPDYCVPRAVVEAFSAGLIAGEEAVDAFFECGDYGFSVSDLSGFCAAAADDEEACIKTAERLSEYDGIISDDSNNDLIPDSFVSYRLGRPASAVYDLNQDGYQDIIVECGFGEPVSVIMPSGDIAVEYDSYPFASSVKSGNTLYSIRPKALRISPVEARPFDFGFLTPSFFFLSPVDGFAFPSSGSLASASVSSMETLEEEGAEISVETVYDGQGRPLHSMQVREGDVFSRTVYKNGIPFESERDDDGDNFFEKKIFYNGEGDIISISVDSDGDKIPEYTENFNGDGSLHISWFEDGLSVPSVQWTKMRDGSSSAVWLHPETSIPVTVLFQPGNSPAGMDTFTVSYRGGSREIFFDSVSGFWWFDNIPEGSSGIASAVNSMLDRENSPVVALSLESGNGFVYVVKVGGKIFAEFIQPE